MHLFCSILSMCQRIQQISLNTGPTGSRQLGWKIIPSSSLVWRTLGRMPSGLGKISPQRSNGNMLRRGQTDVNTHGETKWKRADVTEAKPEPLPASLHFPLDARLLDATTCAAMFGNGR